MWFVTLRQPESCALNPVHGFENWTKLETSLDSLSSAQNDVQNDKSYLKPDILERQKSLAVESGKVELYLRSSLLLGH